jgi:hypothetical protein
MGDSMSHELVGARTLLWFLFSDLNTRFNILIEESAHLQSTVYGLLDTSIELFDKDQLQDCPSDEPGISNPQAVKDRYFERPVLWPFKLHREYLSLTTRDRTLLSLWNALGGMIIGLCSNQETFGQQFSKTWNHSFANSSATQTSSEFYWFFAQRGYFITTAFRFYTQQLEHAHEKVIQFLDTKAGMLPQPILLRRWNSAKYGQFLSSYTRTVSWETKLCISHLRKKDPKATLNEYEHEHLTHTWAHYPTSEALSFRVGSGSAQDAENASLFGGKSMRFGMIRSAYFYLEQPILFPLLYHECAHLQFPRGDALEEDEAAQSINGRHTYFGDRKRASRNLSYLKFAEEHAAFWDQFTEEVWSDAIAIAKAGKGYLVALTLQLFGLSGNSAFAHFDVRDDVIHPLDRLGIEDYRSVELEFPRARDDYFWEARMLVALKVYGKLHPSSDDMGFASTVEHAISLWFRSGREVFGAKVMSFQHEQFWRHREELNKWVTKTVWDVLKKQLGSFDRQVAPDFELQPHALESKSICDQIRATIQKFMDTYLNAEMKYVAPNVEEGTQLTELPFLFRWGVAGAIATRPSLDEKWISGFANTVRHNGSTAFRIGLEWILARESVLEWIADRLTKLRPLGEKHKEQSNTKDRRREDPSDRGPVEKELLELIMDLQSKIANKDELRQRIIRRLRRRGSLPYQPNDELNIMARIHITRTKIERLFADCLPQFNPDLFDDDANCNPDIQAKSALAEIGTLSLGLLRSSWISTFDEPSYISALKQHESFYHSTVKMIEAVPKPRTSGGLLASVFVPAAGDYDFITYTRGSTPSERDSYPIFKHPSNKNKCIPKTLIRPRLVLQVFGEPFCDMYKKTFPSEELTPRFPYGRATLIQFSHRWKWLDLAYRLNKNPKRQENQCSEFPHSALFLSSGWEDVILITWHKNENHLGSVLKDIRLEPGVVSVDTLSSILFPKLCQKPTTLKIQWDNTYAPELGYVIEYHIPKITVEGQPIANWCQTTGRIDYRINWKGIPEKSTALESYVNALQTMPNNFLAAINTMSTSFDFTTSDKTISCSVTTNLSVKLY